MTENASPGSGASICPWCSAALPEPAPDSCPSCGARLVSEGSDLVPGVTAIDAEAVLRSARATTRSRGGLLSWIGGGDDDAGTPPPRGSLDPPSADVLREMRRLALEADLASLRAEVSEIEADDALANGDRIGQAIDTVDAGDQAEARAAAGDAEASEPEAADAGVGRPAGTADFDPDEEGEPADPAAG